MKMVFADTLYWIAIIKPDDSWKEDAERAKIQLGDVRILTTDEVLVEFLAALCKGGEKLREQAVKMVKAILNNANVKVIPQTRESFLRGVDLYGQRLDKEYSLTDCVSMNAMKLESVTKILTSDNHFAQEGFSVLITR